jgi:hypothetical protein
MLDGGQCLAVDQRNRIRLQYQHHGEHGGYSNERDHGYQRRQSSWYCRHGEHSGICQCNQRHDHTGSANRSIGDNH